MTAMGSTGAKVEVDVTFDTSPTSMIEHFYYKGWNRKNEKGIREVVDENVKFRGGLGGKKLRGLKGFLDYMEAAHTALAHNRGELEEIIVDANGKKAAARVKVTGVHKGNFFGVDGMGHEVSYWATVFFTFEGGRIVELWVLSDVDSLKRQIGASSDATFFAPK